LSLDRLIARLVFGDICASLNVLQQTRCLARRQLDDRNSSIVDIYVEVITGQNAKLVALGCWQRDLSLRGKPGHNSLPNHKK